MAARCGRQEALRALRNPGDGCTLPLVVAGAVAGPAAAASIAEERARAAPRAPQPRAAARDAPAMAGAPRGAFILFEGVDRSGKSTQAARLVEALKAQGTPAELWRFPDRKGTVTGKAIDDYLSAPAPAAAAGAAASAGANAAPGSAAGLSDQAIHLLFSANRWEKSAALVDALRRGVTLVVDRYAYSGAAYTSAKRTPGCGLAWCKAPDAGLPAPDVTLWMALPPEAAAARGGFGQERYENAAFQEQVRAAFASVRDASWVDVDASKGVDEVAAEVLREAVDAVRRCREGQPILALWDRAPLPLQGP
ncbi:thymidylate kinase [Raphidocelis subcapitata]|uniref:dTMP kinase n=1 Tax=Raphidocelis subcapitata TaxID=307507 RepID=A0A2V0NPI3_9CHLO|nr:thymidylate kinase [Raphidocelis subcapitata]|eukprot:GBF89531.1 thymidylate kinase [Raphidocelis subcapitata]